MDGWFTAAIKYVCSTRTSIELGVDQVTSMAISPHELVLGLGHLVLGWFNKNIAY